MKKYLFGSWGKDAGLLLLRVCTGRYMALGHGFGKITGGVEGWTKLGQTMEMFGIGFFHGFWGFLAAFSEFVFALLLAAGLFTRVSALFLVGTLGIAGISHLAKGDGWIGHGSAELAFGYVITFMALLVAGAGKYSLDSLIREWNDRN